MKNKIFKSIVKKNPKGNIIKLLNEKDDFTNIRGEVYISKIGKNKIKAWKKHIKANLNLFLIRGKVKFVIFDNNKKFKEFILDSKNNRIYIKNNTIFGFQNLYKEESILISISSINYNSIESKSYNIKELKYKWKV